MVGAVFKANVGELEEEVREGFSRKLRNEFTVVVQRLSGNNSLFVRFKYGCENYLTLNQLSFVIIEKSPVEDEHDVPTIPVIPDETVPLEKGYYHGVHVVLNFHKDDGVDRN